MVAVIEEEFEPRRHQGMYAYFVNCFLAEIYFVSWRHRGSETNRKSLVSRFPIPHNDSHKKRNKPNGELNGNTQSKPVAAEGHEGGFQTG